MSPTDHFAAAVFTRRDLVALSGMTEPNVKAHLARGLIGGSAKRSPRVAQRFTLEELMGVVWMGYLQRHHGITAGVAAAIGKYLALTVKEKIRVRLGQSGGRVATATGIKTGAELGYGRFDRYIGWWILDRREEDDTAGSVGADHSLDWEEIEGGLSNHHNPGETITLVREEYVWRNIVAPCLLAYQARTGVPLTGGFPADYPGPAKGAK